MGGTEAFPRLGRHCAEESCGQLDFLPFKCDACSQMFCLEHRNYKAHGCSKRISKDSVVYLCPFCGKSVKSILGQTSDDTLQQHRLNQCEEKVVQKPKCPVKGCSQTLTFSNRVQCRDCGKDVCLKHRFGSDHRCASAASSAAEAGARKPTSAGAKFLEALSRRTGADCSSNVDSKSYGSSQSKRDGGKSVQAH